LKPGKRLMLCRYDNLLLVSVRNIKPLAYDLLGAVR
jgi:hypothetical protein